MTYTFSIAAARVRPHQSLALHLMIAIVLFATGVLCSGLYWFTAVSPTFASRISAFGILGALCFSTALVVGTLAVRSRRHPRAALRLLEVGVLLTGAVLLFRTGWLTPGLLFSLLALAAGAAYAFETASGRRNAALTLDDRGIHRPFVLRQRHIEWREVKAVLLRRSVLTIDCVDNRLYQYNVPAQTGLDAAAFEAQCAAWIEEGASKRSKSDW